MAARVSVEAQPSVHQAAASTSAAAMASASTSQTTPPQPRWSSSSPSSPTSSLSHSLPSPRTSPSPPRTRAFAADLRGRPQDSRLGSRQGRRTPSRAHNSGASTSERTRHSHTKTNSSSIAAAVAATAATVAAAPGTTAHPHCDFVLLAEFDIDKGSTLAHRYPSGRPSSSASREKSLHGSRAAGRASRALEAQAAAKWTSGAEAPGDGLNGAAVDDDDDDGVDEELDSLASEGIDSEQSSHAAAAIEEAGAEGYGYDDHMLAELMLPDGAHARAEDWTTFFLRRPRRRRRRDGGAGAGGAARGRASLAGLEGGKSADRKRDDEDEEDEEQELEVVNVINFVRTKHDDSVRRGALVKAMAIGSRHPFIHVFKPLLVAAMAEYFDNPGLENLARLYASINAIDLSAMPSYTRNEKLILRSNDCIGLFVERFPVSSSGNVDGALGLQPGPSSGSMTPGVLPGRASRASNHLNGALLEQGSARDAEAAPPDPGADDPQVNQHPSSSPPPRQPPMDRRPSAHSLRADSPAVLNRRPSAATLLSMESGTGGEAAGASTGLAGTRPRKSSGPLARIGTTQPNATPPGEAGMDTRFYETSVQLSADAPPMPLRIPLTTFEEEVGEYSLHNLLCTFSQPSSTPSGPLHAHLHSNGHLTHAVVLLFNAVVTAKRVVFLGHNLPAQLVASHVLAACALASGCGVTLRGLRERAFPYCNLGMMDELEKTPGYIAGVTNPRFEELRAWDVLFNVETGRVTVAKDVEPPPPLPLPPPRTSLSGVSSGFGSVASSTTAFSNGSGGGAGIGYDGSLRSYTDSSSEAATTSSSVTAVGSTSSGFIPGRRGLGGVGNSAATSATGIEARPDAPEALFMEEMLSAISARCGERYLRARFGDFAQTFTRAAARHREHYRPNPSSSSTTSSSLATPTPWSLPPSQPYLNGQLGSGPGYVDRDAELREVPLVAQRCEAFWATKAGALFARDEAQRFSHRSIMACDAAHQVLRLRTAKRLAAGEADLIFATLARHTRSVEQVLELLSLCPPYLGGLAPLACGLLSSSDIVRTSSLDLLSHVCTTSGVGKRYVQGLNLYLRLTFARQLYERNEAAALAQAHYAAAMAQRASAQQQQQQQPHSGASKPASTASTSPRLDRGSQPAATSGSAGSGAGGGSGGGGGGGAGGSGSGSSGTWRGTMPPYAFPAHQSAAQPRPPSSAGMAASAATLAASSAKTAGGGGVTWPTSASSSSSTTTMTTAGAAAAYDGLPASSTNAARLPFAWKPTPSASGATVTETAVAEGESGTAA